MGPSEQRFTIGVEEEFLIIDPRTRRLRPQAEKVVPEAERELGDNVDPEFKLSQVETSTPPCDGLDELRNELVQLRRGVIQAAERADSLVGAAGTHPFSHQGGGEVTPQETYIGLEREYQRLAREKVICGCHVHVGVSDREAAVQVMNRVRPRALDSLGPGRQLTVLARRGHGLRELSDRGLASVAHVRHAARVCFVAGVRRLRQPALGERRHRRPGQALLGRPSFSPLRDAGVQGHRRVSERRRLPRRRCPCPGP